MSAITLTHKIRLDPTCKQENYFRQACGVARFTWNWALAEWKKQYEAGKKPNGLDLKKQFNTIKPIEFPWTYNVTKYASQHVTSVLIPIQFHRSNSQPFSAF